MPKHTNKSSDDGSGSFEEFYARYRQVFVKRLSRYMSVHDAEDLAQDMFMAVWKAQKVRKIRSLYGVAARTAQRKLVDLLRKERTRRNYEEQFEPIWELLQSVPPAVEAAALQAERSRALLQLRKEHSEAYLAYCLREYGELDFAEIATVMGIGRNKAAKLVWIARLALDAAEVKEGKACVR